MSEDEFNFIRTLLVVSIAVESILLSVFGNIYSVYARYITTMKKVPNIKETSQPNRFVYAPIVVFLSYCMWAISLLIAIIAGMVCYLVIFHIINLTSVFYAQLMLYTLTFVCFLIPFIPIAISIKSNKVEFKKWKKMKLSKI